MFSSPFKISKNLVCHGVMTTARGKGVMLSLKHFMSFCVPGVVVCLCVFSLIEVALWRSEHRRFKWVALTSLIATNTLPENSPVRIQVKLLVYMIERDTYCVLLFNLKLVFNFRAMTLQADSLNFSVWRLIHGSGGSQGKALGPLELELQVVTSHYVGAGN